MDCDLKPKLALPPLLAPGLDLRDHWKPSAVSFSHKNESQSDRQVLSCGVGQFLALGRFSIFSVYFCIKYIGSMFDSFSIFGPKVHLGCF